jgi:PadR family transcriptional regulator, regulatory protein PadR
MQIIRKTHATTAVLRTLMNANAALCGADICRMAGVQGGTLYKMLRRLEDAGWLDGEWEDGDPRSLSRPLRRYYKLSPSARIRHRLANSAEFTALTVAQQTAVVTAIQTGQSINTDGGEAYAYPDQDGMVWGFNAGDTGFKIACGVVTA